MDSRVREARPADVEAAVDTLAAAFADHPFARRAMPAGAEPGVCFLETALEPSPAFCRRPGFDVTAEADPPGGGPPTWTMRRAVVAAPDGRPDRF